MILEPEKLYKTANNLLAFILAKHFDSDLFSVRFSDGTSFVGNVSDLPVNKTLVERIDKEVHYDLASCQQVIYHNDKKLFLEELGAAILDTDANILYSQCKIYGFEESLSITDKDLSLDNLMLLLGWLKDNVGFANVVFTREYGFNSNNSKIEQTGHIIHFKSKEECNYTKLCCPLILLG